MMIIRHNWQTKRNCCSSKGGAGCSNGGPPTELSPQWEPGAYGASITATSLHTTRTHRRLPIEEWREVTGWPEYIVSSYGQVRRVLLGRGSKGGRMRPEPASNGYPRVSYHSVHDLVCSAFHGTQPSPLHEVAHGDGDRLNCRAENLRWALHSENELDRCLHGRAAKALTPDAVRSIRLRNHSIRNTAELFGVCESTVKRIRNGRIWSWLPQGELT